MSAELRRVDAIAWDDMRILLHVAEAGSMHSAAKAARVSLNTVRAGVDRIEHHLRVPVVDRLRHGCVPTDAGTSIVEIARGIRELVQKGAL